MPQEFKIQPIDVPLPPVKVLSAGSLKCLYENGCLRYIRIGDLEIVRMIYAAARDENWETAKYTISDEVIEDNVSSFTIKYTAVYNLNQIRYKAVFTIEGKDDTISFSMKGLALCSFQTNRIGICVLHPIQECAGKQVLIVQPDGGRYEGTFPKEIIPHQPFKQVQQMHWKIEDRVEAELNFEGDVFETEDQRNWTDASYKTYSRPLDLPHPYAVMEGEVMEQKITLKVTVDKNECSRPENVPLPALQSADEIKVPFPKIGYCRTKSLRALTEIEIKLLHKVPFDHYRVEIHLAEAGWKEELSIAIAEARELATKLELVVLFTGKIETELQAIIEQLEHKKQYVYSLLVLQEQQPVTPDGLMEHIYGVLKHSLSTIEIGYGTDAHFVELNRNRPQISSFDFISYSIHPQAHATDTRSIIENLEAQADTIQTAGTFANGKAIHISPVTLKKRSHPGASRVLNSATNADYRQHTWLAAHWTLHSIKNLSGASSITFYETVGAEGIIKDKEASTPLKESEEALLTPIYKVLAAIKAFRPKTIVFENSNDNTNRKTVLLENKEGERMTFTTETESAFSFRD